LFLVLEHYTLHIVIDAGRRYEIDWDVGRLTVLLCMFVGHGDSVARAVGGDVWLCGLVTLKS